MIASPTLDRRSLLRIALPSLAGLGGCARFAGLADPHPTGANTARVAPPEPKSHHRLVRARATYGDDDTAFPSTTDGLAAWIRHQCTAPHETLGLWTLATGSEDPGLRWRLGSIEALRTGALERPNAGFELRDVSQPEMLRQLTKAALLRACYSRWQLRERMVEFWSDHFNIYARKVAVARDRRQTDAELMYLIPADQNQVVRPHALGSFRDLVRASMRSPAMLGYLDNHVSKKGKPNENYARELMELHTLGVDGGYSQADVHEVARCLTGWTIEDRFLHRAGTVRFDPALHDDGAKVVLGETIPPGGGPRDAEQVLEILIGHPSTARFVARKLVSSFFGDPVRAQGLVDATARAFRQSNGQIATAVEAMFTDERFADASPLVKRPFDLMTSAVRATGAITDGDQGIQSYLEKMGQPLHQWPMPDGYPVDNEAWEANLLPRWNFAEALAANAIPGTRLEPSAARERLRLWPAQPSTSDTERIAAVLCAPEFQWK